MTSNPVESWHRALTPTLARESFEWLNQRQREQGLTFGERPLCAVIRPRLLHPDGLDNLRRACDSVLGAFAVAGQAAIEDRAIRDQFGLADWEATLLESAPRLPSLAPLSRLDAFADPTDGTIRITEYNAETPAGTGYTDALSRLFLALPAMQPFLQQWRVAPIPALHLLYHTLLECWHAFRGVRTLPAIAIVDWSDVPTLSEFRICRDYFDSQGCRTVIATPSALSYEGGVLRDGAGTRIDLIYKRVLLHELVGQCGLDHPMVRAVVDGAVCMVNPFSCKALHKKASLAVLSDERNAHLFSRGQRAAIDAHIPWTRVVAERKTQIDGQPIDLVPWVTGHRDELVLKPNDDYGGAGIVLGWEVNQGTWEAAVNAALGTPYVVQRRISLPSEPFATVVDGDVVFDERIVDSAPYCWQGAWSEGLLCRISTSALVNVTAGSGSTVPTFVVERR